MENPQFVLNIGIFGIHFPKVGKNGWQISLPPLTKLIKSNDNVSILVDRWILWTGLKIALLLQSNGFAGWLIWLVDSLFSWLVD